MCVKNKKYTEREFYKLLKKNGYRKLKNTSGTDHSKWENAKGDIIPVPSGKKDLNPMLTQGIIKRHNLREDI